MPYADFERFIAESWTYCYLTLQFVGYTFDEDASKQSSSPIRDRPTRILENGRREEDGMVASNNVVAPDEAILATGVSVDQQKLVANFRIGLNPSLHKNFRLGNGS
jgi:hypothetical protein